MIPVRPGKSLGLGAAGLLFAIRGPGVAVDPSGLLAFFEKEVRPLLVKQCQKRHGSKKQASGLRVDSRAAFIEGGESGPAVVPGKPEKGTLLRALRHTGVLHMPWPAS